MAISDQDIGDFMEPPSHHWVRLRLSEAVTETKRRRGLIGPIPLRDCLAFVLAMVFIGALIGAYLTGNY